MKWRLQTHNKKSVAIAIEVFLKRPDIAKRIREDTLREEDLFLVKYYMQDSLIYCDDPYKFVPAL